MRFFRALILTMVLVLPVTPAQAGLCNFFMSNLGGYFGTYEAGSFSTYDYLAGTGYGLDFSFTVTMNRWVSFTIRQYKTDGGNSQEGPIIAKYTAAIRENSVFKYFKKYRKNEDDIKEDIRHGIGNFLLNSNVAFVPSYPASISLYGGRPPVVHHEPGGSIAMSLQVYGAESGGKSGPLSVWLMPVPGAKAYNIILRSGSKTVNLRTNELTQF